MGALGLLAAFSIMVGASVETLDQRVAVILPRPDEQRFLEIPWHTDLLRARRAANSEGKPIFLWIMNGSPLGCT